MPLRYLTFALLVACSVEPAPLGWVEAEPVARARGIGGFTVLAEAPDRLTVLVDGGSLLRVRVAHGEVEQVLDRFVLRTARGEVAIGDRTVARRVGDRWATEPLAARDAEALGRIMALDITLAVQGSSVVFGDTYVPCTLRCERAEACTTNLARCADDIVVCAACLERAP